MHIHIRPPFSNTHFWLDVMLCCIADISGTQKQSGQSEFSLCGRNTWQEGTNLAVPFVISQSLHFKKQNPECLKVVHTDTWLVTALCWANSSGSCHSPNQKEWHTVWIYASRKHATVSTNFGLLSLSKILVCTWKACNKGCAVSQDEKCCKVWRHSKNLPFHTSNRCG